MVHSSLIGHNNPPSNNPQTLAWEPLDSLHILACSRVALNTVLSIVPEKYYRAIAENAPRPCCHSTGNLDIEAWYSCPDEQAKGKPDIYKFYCNECDACHVRFCIGGDHVDAVKHTPETRPDLFDIRPFWEIR